jgi:Terminase large subunit, T4likevirus-type, N-terminal
MGIKTGDLNVNVMTTKKVDEIIRKENLGMKKTRNENIWFQNNKQVRKANVTFAMTDNELEEYIKCKRSVLYFAEKYCKIKREDGTIGEITLRDYQIDMINLFDRKRYSILMASRQSGKTISVSIYILWFVLFHDDKGVMIVANKGATVIEIMEKIKSIYKYLPFFLKKGAINWGQKKISLENGCRVQTETRSKEPAIGFTVDLLYFDEFAHIPSNYIEPYYRAAIPTISAIEDSKIIITSTPLGFNLFHRIWEKANKDEDDLEKGVYSPLKVLWWQKEGRRDIWLFPIKKVFEKYKLKPEAVYKWIQDNNYKTYNGKEDGKICKKIKFEMDREEITNIDFIRALRYNTIPFPELFKITNWKEEQIKLIEGEDNFKQEFEVKFMTGDKSLFDDVQMEKLSKSKLDFKHIKIPFFDKKLKTSYEQLTFINDPRIFDIRKAKDYFIVGGIDFSEGLGKDFTVMTLYKLKLKSRNLIKKSRHKFNSIYDFFQIEQIGQFRSNVHSIKEFAHIFYVTCFDLFDPEKVKLNFEYNNFGGEFLAHLPNVFEGENQYSNSIFARTKHTKDAKISKLGVKINQNKKTFIKNYQDSFKFQNIIVHNKFIIKEMETFTRHDTPSGDYTYRSESGGNDDCVMSVINACTIFNNIAYKDLIEVYLNDVLTQEEKNFIEGIVIDDDQSISHSYNMVIGTRKKLNNSKEYLKNIQTKKDRYNSNLFPSKPNSIPYSRF